LLFGIAPSTSAAPPDAQAKRSPVLAALQAEMERSMKTLSTLDPPAYLHGVYGHRDAGGDVSGSNGALLNSNETRNRWLEVSVRTGSYALDNSHKVGERQQQSGGPGAPVPIDDDAEVLRRTIWLETDKQYRAASEALIKIKTGKEVKVETAEGRAPIFFAGRTARFRIGPQVSIAVDRKPWEERVRAYTKGFANRRRSSIPSDVRGAGAKRVPVTSEKDELQYGQISLRLELFIQASAGRNGHRPLLQFWIGRPQGRTGRQSGVRGRSDDAQGVGRTGRRAHQRSDRWTGAADGTRRGVFFHEVFGHRAEGHRRKT